MALHCLALLGSKNEPLYLCGGAPDDDVSTSDHDETPLGEEDHFGFLEGMSAKSSSSIRPASIRHEVNPKIVCVFVVGRTSGYSRLHDIALSTMLTTCRRCVCRPINIREQIRQ